MSSIYIQKKGNINFQKCLGQLARDPKDTQIKTIEGVVYMAIEIFMIPYIVSFTEQEKQIICCVENASCDRHAKKHMRDYINCLFDVGAELEPFIQIAQSAPLRLQFKPVFEISLGLRLIGIPDLFHALTWSIIGQQISLVAAFSIKNRLCESFGKPVLFKQNIFYMHPTLQELANADIASLKSVGLSRQKASYLLNIIEVFSRNPSLLAELSEKSTQDIAQYLISIKGIGKWSADYVLLRCFKRYEIFPSTDAALINSIKILNNMGEKPTQNDVIRVFRDWEGWGGYLCFYLWNWHTNRNAMKED